MRFDHLFFAAAHSDYALLFWASIILFLLAKVWMLISLIWLMADDRGRRVVFLPVIVATSLELVVGWYIYLTVH
ncbi:MAG: hypothetical protein ACM3PC_09160 [Deltaproteobacteria bacterium]